MDNEFLVWQIYDRKDTVILHWCKIYPLDQISRSMTQKITGRVADFTQKIFYPAEITLKNGRISAIERLAVKEEGLPFILPGFTDSHVHIESSLLLPAEFARLAVVHGTVATVSDPHEIANVCGLEGVDYMIENGKTVPFKFNFGAPSCVPATVFETAGAHLDATAVDQLLSRPEIKYLSEMMNFPGVLSKDPEVMDKIAAAKKYGKPVDGHAPGLRGDTARQYAAAGISTDHECFTKEEALDKLQLGMKILIREGSAARNFEALIDLLHDYPDQIMFCSDDKHPDSLVVGHINQLCARAVAKGIDVFKVLQAACINPIRHYGLGVGLLQIEDPADLIIVEDLEHFTVRETYINGACVARNGVSLIDPKPQPAINRFTIGEKSLAEFAYPLLKFGEEENFEQVYVIEALDGQLITHKRIHPITDVAGKDDLLHSNVEKDLLKIVVVNRYQPMPIAKSFIRNFGLKKGALSSSVAHDSHNIVAVGVDDESLCDAVNRVIQCRGGLSLSFPGKNGQEGSVLPLPVAGLMSTGDGYEVAEAYTQLDRMSKEVLGATLRSPYMTLSFMALLVIPELKLSDKGLFDAGKWGLV